MLKKIHFVKPSVQSREHQKHAQRSKQLKNMVSDGSKRQSLVQAARELIISKDFSKDDRKRAGFLMQKPQRASSGLRHHSQTEGGLSSRK